MIAKCLIGSAGNEKWLYGGSKATVKLCLPAVASQPTGEHTMRKVNVRSKNKAKPMPRCACNCKKNASLRSLHGRQESVESEK